MRDTHTDLGPAIFLSQLLNCGRFGCAADGGISPSLGNDGTQECFELVHGDELNAKIVFAPAVLSDDGLAEYCASWRTHGYSGIGLRNSAFRPAPGASFDTSPVNLRSHSFGFE